MSRGLSDSPWPSRSNVITRLPRSTSSLRQRLVHAARQQQARQQHQVAAALAVDLVGELLPSVLEARHRALQSNHSTCGLRHAFYTETAAAKRLIFRAERSIIATTWRRQCILEAARSRALAVDGHRASRYLLRLASDEKLVGRVRAGSEPAFAVLYERHHRGILSFCRHMLGSREEAEDAVQQTFANAYRDLLRERPRASTSSPGSTGSLATSASALLRARRHDSRAGGHEPSLVGLSRSGGASETSCATCCATLRRLPFDQREALVLAELHDNSHAEVAAILGCEREKVKSLVFQARSSLIKSREARETPCEEIRRAAQRRFAAAPCGETTIRRHLKQCDGCRAFTAERWSAAAPGARGAAARWSRRRRSSSAPPTRSRRPASARRPPAGFGCRRRWPRASLGDRSVTALAGKLGCRRGVEGCAVTGAVTRGRRR